MQELLTSRSVCRGGCVEQQQWPPSHTFKLFYRFSTKSQRKHFNLLQNSCYSIGLSIGQSFDWDVFGLLGFLEVKTWYLAFRIKSYTVQHCLCPRKAFKCISTFNTNVAEPVWLEMLHSSEWGHSILHVFLPDKLQKIPQSGTWQAIHPTLTLLQLLSPEKLTPRTHRHSFLPAVLVLLLAEMFSLRLGRKVKIVNYRDNRLQFLRCLGRGQNKIPVS